VWSGRRQRVPGWIQAASVPTARWRQIETDEPSGGVWVDAAMECARTRRYATIVSDRGAGRVVWGAYESAVTARAPNARIVFDRCHVQRLAHEAL
jgi:hypothetical protein